MLGVQSSETLDQLQERLPSESTYKYMYNYTRQMWLSYLYPVHTHKK